MIMLFKEKYFFVICSLFFWLVFLSNSALAAPSLSEWKNFLSSYKGDFVFSLDSDGDGFSDDLEIEKSYSPFSKEEKNIDLVDSDKDGLSDGLEIVLGSDPINSDSDKDGYADGLEFDNAFSPVSSSTERLKREIRIYLGEQKMEYVIDDIAWKSFPISSGKASMPTPKGEYKISNKIKKAWSSTYGLWMPYWLGLGRGGIGIHELPVWPNGYREGENHLGKAVSHGCIRLGIGAAEYIYSRVDVGTPVIVK